MNRYFYTLVAGVVSLAAVIIFVCASTVWAASLGDLVSGPAGSNGGGTSSAGTSGNTGSSSTGSPNLPPLQILNFAESGPVSAASGACPNVSCNDSGQCVAISFDDVLGIGATNPSSSGRAPGSTSSSGSGGKSSRAKGTPATSTIHGPGGLVGVSVCFTADQALGSSNSTGGTCFPVSGSGTLNGQTLTASGTLCTETGGSGSLFTIQAAYGTENDTAPGAGSVSEVIDANSGLATVVIQGTTSSALSPRTNPPKG